MLGMQIQKGWAHDATLLPCNYCYALGRLDSWVNNCTTQQKISHSKGKPMCMVAKCSKTQLAFYPNLINTLQVTYLMVKIHVYHTFLPSRSYSFLSLQPISPKGYQGCGSLGHVPNPRRLGHMAQLCCPNTFLAVGEVRQPVERI